MHKIRRINSFLFLTPFFILVFFGCDLFLDSLYDDIGATPVVIGRDAFALAWEAEEPAIPELPSAVNHYNLYARTLFSKEWELIQETDGFTQKTFLSVGRLGGSGSYELGIAEVLNDGTIGEVHSSLDFDARPVGGWYLKAVSP